MSATFLYHAVKMADIQQFHLDGFQLVLKLLREDKTLLDLKTCHEVCDYIANVVPCFESIRGHFMQKGFEHSWLMFKNSLVLVDPYPIAGAAPLIITLEGTINPWKKIYLPTTRKRL